VSGPFQGGGEAPRVSVVVVSYNTREELLACLASLHGVRLPLEVIVVDNASSDASADGVRGRFPTARVVAETENLGFARASNRGWRRAAATDILFLNSDAELRPGALETMSALLDARPEVGIVGPRTRNTDGTLQVACGLPLTPLGEWRQGRLVEGVRRRDPQALAQLEARCAREHEPAWVSGACLLARRRTLEVLGGFDERFFLYEEDVDLCHRAHRAGFRVVHTPEAEVVHHLGRSMARAASSRVRFEYDRSHLLYYRKHNGPLLATLLRFHLLARAVSLWLGLLDGGERPPERRAQAGALLRLAVFGS
jgi:N-acetylglucosaminyl-diphospho-decaprenol L-rhamnosyltransferase